jgi:hypothetical protein
VFSYAHDSVFLNYFSSEYLDSVFYRDLTPHKPVVACLRSRHADRLTAKCEPIVHFHLRGMTVGQSVYFRFAKPGRVRVRFQMRSVSFSTDLNFPAALWP